MPVRNPGVPPHEASAPDGGDVARKGVEELFSEFFERQMGRGLDEVERDRVTSALGRAGVRGGGAA